MRIFQKYYSQDAASEQEEEHSRNLLDILGAGANAGSSGRREISGHIICVLEAQELQSERGGRLISRVLSVGEPHVSVVRLF